MREGYCNCPSVKQPGYFRLTADRFIPIPPTLFEQGEGNVAFLFCPRCGSFQALGQMTLPFLPAPGSATLLQLHPQHDGSLELLKGPSEYQLEVSFIPGKGIYGKATDLFIREYTAPFGMAPRYLHRTKEKIMTPDVEAIRRLPGTTLQKEESTLR